MCDHVQTHMCQHPTANPSVAQTLDELDFTRGIWNAALNGQYEDVKNCLEKKNIAADCQDHSGYTALHYSSRHGHTDICKLLLDHGASPNIQSYAGAVTPLHRGAYCGHREIVMLLLEYGANPLLADGDGKTPLHKAAESGHKEVVELLMKSCPDSVSVRDNRGQTPADCVPQQSPDIKQLLR